MAAIVQSNESNYRCPICWEDFTELNPPYTHEINAGEDKDVGVGSAVAVVKADSAVAAVKTDSAVAAVKDGEIDSAVAAVKDVGAGHQGFHVKCLRDWSIHKKGLPDCPLCKKDIDAVSVYARYDQQVRDGVIKEEEEEKLDPIQDQLAAVQVQGPTKLTTADKMLAASNLLKWGLVGAASYYGMGSAVTASIGLAAAIGSTAATYYMLPEEASKTRRAITLAAPVITQKVVELHPALNLASQAHLFYTQAKKTLPELKRAWQELREDPLNAVKTGSVRLFNLASGVASVAESAGLMADRLITPKEESGDLTLWDKYWVCHTSPRSDHRIDEIRAKIESCVCQKKLWHGKPANVKLWPNVEQRASINPFDCDRNKFFPSGWLVDG